MEVLKQRILNEGVCLGDSIIKVDRFLNHQIDVALLNEIGEEFKRRFAHQSVTKILTIEASGIAIACVAAQHFNNVPVVFAKKQEAANLVGNIYTSEVFSYTKNKCYNVRVSADYLSKDDCVLIIDDFLANGNAALGLMALVEQSGARLAGVGVVIEKGFQNGRQLILEKGCQLESLAIIKSIENGILTFS